MVLVNKFVSVAEVERKIIRSLQNCEMPVILLLSLSSLETSSKLLIREFKQVQHESQVEL